MSSHYERLKAQMASSAAAEQAEKERAAQAKAVRDRIMGRLERDLAALVPKTEASLKGTPLAEFAAELAQGELVGPDGDPITIAYGYFEREFAFVEDDGELKGDLEAEIRNGFGIRPLTAKEMAEAARRIADVDLEGDGQLKVHRSFRTLAYEGPPSAPVFAASEAAAADAARNVALGALRDMAEAYRLLVNGYDPLFERVGLDDAEKAMAYSENSRDDAARHEFRLVAGPVLLATSGRRIVEIVGDDLKDQDACIAKLAKFAEENAVLKVPAPGR